MGRGVGKPELFAIGQNEEAVASRLVHQNCRHDQSLDWMIVAPVAAPLHFR